MKVDKIYQNYQEYDSSKRMKYNHSQVGFAGKNPNSLPDRITNSLPGKKILQFMQEKLSWMKGEIGGVAMTAIGTGAVAPWSIAFNPMVKPKKGATKEEKEDLKNTKYYTAWRQPISAILAAIFQIGALTPIDKFLDYLYNTPELAKHFDVDTNQSVLNNDGFVKRKMKKEMKKDGLSKSSMGKANYETELKSRMKAFQESQIESLAEKIKETHKIQVGKEFIDDKKVANIVNEQINGYISDAEKLKINKEYLEFYSKRAKVLIENEDYLKKIFENLPEDSLKLQEKLKELAKKETNSDVKKLIEEILDRSADIQASRIKRTFQRINKIKHICGKEYSPEKYMQAMIERNGELDNIIKNLEACKIKDMASAKPSDIEKAIQKAVDSCHFDGKNPLQTSILHDAKTFGTNKEKLSTKIYKDIAKGYKKFVQKSYKSHNQIWKIAIGVCITLPITCNVLNWVYPRFMNWAFPDLSKSKVKQKQLESQNQGKEVK